MHHLLKRQLKKTSATVDKKFLELVNQAYLDADEDRNLLEHSLDISSVEMKELYEKLQKSSQEKIRLSQERYNKLVNALRSHYFFYAHDTDGVFVYLSDSVTDILGYSVEEFLTHYETYLTNDTINDNVFKMTNRAIRGLSSEPYIISVFHKDQTICYLEVMELPIFDDKGNVIEVEGIARDITTQYKTQKKLDYISQHDSLTGILNRLSLHTKLKYVIANAHRNKQIFALLFLDLDHFKKINDTMGHNIGDEVLKTVTSRIQLNIRQTDIFARIGGDEFVLILSDVDEHYISSLASKIIQVLNEPFQIQNFSLSISVSIGITIYPKDGKSISTLLKNADKAMYTTKKSGKNNFHYFSKNSL